MMCWLWELKYNEIRLIAGDKLYMFSDGFIDQVGGKNSKKFLTSNFKKLLLNIHQKPMHEQNNILNKTIEDWKTGYQQVDDILVIGIEVND